MTGRSAMLCRLMPLMLAVLGAACARHLDRGCAPQACPVRTALGPAAGFAVTQVLTATATATWQWKDPAHPSPQGHKDTGLRLEVRSEVTGRKGDLITVRSTIRKTEILQDGAFIPAPFLALNPPGELTFSLDLARRTIDFSAAEQAWRSWMDGLRNTPAWEVLSVNLDVPSYAAQMRDLLARPILDHAGRTYRPGETITEIDRFSLPFLGPGLYLAPAETSITIGLDGAHALEGRRVILLSGTSFADTLLLPEAEVRARTRSAPGLAFPPLTNEGTMRGTYRAEVDQDTGWTLAVSSAFTASLKASFPEGDLTEEISGRRLVETR